MTKKDKKIPSSQDRCNVKKEVRVKQNNNVNDKPSWRFSTVDKSGNFKWPLNTEKELEILQKLHNFDSMLWSKIVGSDNHFISVKDLSNEAKSRLKEINQDDIDEIFSFRLNGKARVFCIRESNIAKLLWYDPDHKVCISHLKHT